MTLQINTPTEPAADPTPTAAPGPVDSGKRWVLRHEGDGWWSTDRHFPTWEEANQEVRIAVDEWSTTYDLIGQVDCDTDPCLRKRRHADIAYREDQARLAAEEADAEQERRQAETAHRDRLVQLQLDKAAADREHQEHLRELQQDEAEYRKRRLQLLIDEADHREQLHQLQADEAADAAAAARAWRLVDGARAEIGKADAKAGIVITLELALIGAAGSGALGAAGLLRWATIATLLIGVLGTAWAVMPRPPRRTAGEGRDRLDYGAIRTLDRPELAARLRGIDEVEAASAEAVTLARITHAKYTRIRWAMLAGAAGMVLAAITAGIGVA